MDLRDEDLDAIFSEQGWIEGRGTSTEVVRDPMEIEGRKQEQIEEPHRWEGMNEDIFSEQGWIPEKVREDAPTKDRIHTPIEESTSTEGKQIAEELFHSQSPPPIPISTQLQRESQRWISQREAEVLGRKEEIPSGRERVIGPTGRTKYERRKVGYHYHGSHAVPLYQPQWSSSRSARWAESPGAGRRVEKGVKIFGMKPSQVEELVIKQERPWVIGGGVLTTFSTFQEALQERLSNLPSYLSLDQLLLMIRVFLTSSDGLLKVYMPSSDRWMILDWDAYQRNRFLIRVSITYTSERGEVETRTFNLYQLLSSLSQIDPSYEEWVQVDGSEREEG